MSSLDHSTPRILYLGFAKLERYISPTHKLFVRKLLSCPGAVAIGPGYCDYSQFNTYKSVEAKYGAFDVVVAEPYLVAPVVPDEMKGDPRLEFKFEEGAVPPLVISLMRADIHGLVEEQLTVHGHIPHLICTSAGSGFFPTQDVERAEKETWYSEGSERLKDVLTHQTTLLPHCIADDEWLKVSERTKYDLSILGCAYNARKKAREFAGKRSEFSVTTLDNINTKVIRKMCSWFGNHPPSCLQRLYHRRMMTELNRSRLSITCEGSGGYPIRKFFEIPAAGSLLLARMFPYPENLGFLPGENCLQFDEDDETTFFEAVDFALGDSTERMRILQRGREMIRDCHSVDVRGRQLFEVVKRVAEGSSLESKWRGGELNFSKSVQ